MCEAHSPCLTSCDTPDAHAYWVNIVIGREARASAVPLPLGVQVEVEAGIGGI